MPALANKIKIAQHFGAASKSYDASSRLQRFSGKHLMPWLSLNHDAVVVDLGSGTGFFTDILAKQYQHVIGLDISTKMLKFARSRSDNKIHWLEADIGHLPLQNNSVDIIYSNLVLQWCEPLAQHFAEMYRVLKPGGKIVFSTLLYGTLHELKSSWAQVDDDQHVIDFKSEIELLHELKQAGLALSDQQRHTLKLEYANVFHVAHELKGMGANHLPHKQAKGLAGRGKWQKMAQAYQDFVEPSGIYPATYELLLGLIEKTHD